MSLKKKTLKKAVSFVTAITTVVWLSGVSMLVVPVASAAIVDGDLIKSNATNPDGTPTLSSLDVYIVKLVGSKKFKRLILNPQVFASYGHLDWNNIQTVSQAVMDEYNTSSLVRVDTDPAEKVYALVPQGDTGAKGWVNLSSADFLANANSDSDAIYTINSTDAGNYATGTDITTTSQLASFYSNGVLPGGVSSDSVAVSGDTPASTVVAKGANNVVFTKLNFTAGTADYTISKIAITRSGIANDTDVSAVKLYDGATQVGSSQAVNSNTHKATFSSLNILVPAGTTKTITVKGNIKSDAGTNSVILGVAAASDITSTATSLGGTFPINGNAMSIASISVGQVNVDVDLNVPAASEIISGSTAQHVANIKFTATSTEGISVQSVKLAQVGTASATDITNVVLKYGDTTLATIPTLNANGTATANFSPALSLNTSASKTVNVYVDVASGINTSRTVKIEVTQADDVVAIGSNSQGSVTVAADAGAGTFPQLGAQHTISQGTLTTALDAALNPSAQSYVKGTSGRDVTALRFSTGSTEGVRLTQIKLTNSGTATPTDVNNFVMYKDGVEIATGSVSGSTSTFTVQFGTNSVNAFDNPGLFDVAAGTNATIVVKADISSAASANTIILSVAAATDVKADGLSSQLDVPSASVTGTTTGSTLTISANGALSVTTSSSTPAATTIGKNIQGRSLAKFDLTASSGEDITVSSVTVRAYKNADTTGTVAATGDVTNMKAFIGDIQVGSTVASPNAGVATFSINTVVPAGTVKTLEIKGDIPTGTTATSIHVDLPGAGTIASDMTSTGNSSTADIEESGSATGKLMTIAAPTVTAAMSTTPAASSKVKSATGVTIGRLLLTAGSAEDVKVSTIKVTFDDAATLSTDSTASAKMRNVTLYNGTTKIGETTSVITDGTTAADYANFTGITNLTITKAQTAAVDIKVDLVDTGAFYAGIAANTGVTGSGVNSSTAISTASGTFPAASALLTITGTGTLVVTADASTPVNANIAVGTTGATNVEFSKIKFTTQYEAAKISTLVLARTGTTNTDSNFVKVKLYDGATQVGPDGYVSSGTVTFNFASGSEYEVPADTYKVLTVKADLNGVGFGVTHADAPILGISDTTNTAIITAQGAQSSASIEASGTVTTYAKTLYKTTITADTDLTVVPSNAAAGASASQKVMAIKITNGGAYDATITTLAPTVSTSDTSLSGTTGMKAYWNDDNTQLTGGAAGSGSALANATKYTMTITANNTIAAGTTRVLYITADTVGVDADKTFQINIAAVEDLGWKADGSAEVTTLTKNLPLTGPSFKY